MENEPLENGNATSKFFREIKSNSITKILSPTNCATDTAQFFGDLNQNYNLGTKRYPTQERSGSICNPKTNNLKIMRGSIGGKLGKIKIKSEANTVNNGTLR